MSEESKEQWTIEKAVKEVDRFSWDGCFARRAEICAYFEIQSSIYRDALDAFHTKQISEKEFLARKKMVDGFLHRVPKIKYNEPSRYSEENDAWKWAWYSFTIALQHFRIFSTSKIAFDFARTVLESESKMSEVRYQLEQWTQLFEAFRRFFDNMDEFFAGDGGEGLQGSAVSRVGMALIDERQNSREG